MPIKSKTSLPLITRPMLMCYRNMARILFEKTKFKIKLIHISTPEVYGSTTGKITEDYQYNPNSPYATSRVAPEFFLNVLQHCQI